MAESFSALYPPLGMLLRAKKKAFTGSVALSFLRHLSFRKWSHKKENIMVFSNNMVSKLNVIFSFSKLLHITSITIL